MKNKRIKLVKVTPNSRDYEFRRTGELWYFDGRFQITNPNTTNEWRILGDTLTLTNEDYKQFLDCSENLYKDYVWNSYCFEEPLKSLASMTNLTEDLQEKLILKQDNYLILTK